MTQERAFIRDIYVICQLKVRLVENCDISKAVKPQTGNRLFLSLKNKTFVLKNSLHSVIWAQILDDTVAHSCQNTGHWYMWHVRCIFLEWTLHYKNRFKWGAFTLEALIKRSLLLENHYGTVLITECRDCCLHFRKMLEHVDSRIWQ